MITPHPSGAGRILCAPAIGTAIERNVTTLHEYPMTSYGRTRRDDPYESTGSTHRHAPTVKQLAKVVIASSGMRHDRQDPPLAVNPRAANPAVHAPENDERALAAAQARARLYLRQRLTLWAGNLGLQLVCVSVLYPFHPPWMLAAWVLANASLLLLRARATARLRRGDVAGVAGIDAWFRVLARYLFGAGLIWGLGAFVLLPPLHDPRALVFLLTLMGVCWGAAVSLSMAFPAVVAFIVPVTTLTATRLALSETETGVLLTILTAAFTGFVLATARNYARAVDVTLRLDSENLALLAEVSAARDAAERASAEKSRFLAAVSHDLRQPLHAARLAVEALAADARPGDAPRSMAGAVRALRDLETQFDGLLELSELEAGVLRPRPCDFALGPLLADLAREFTAPARARGLALSVPPATVSVHSDPRLVRRILRNLLDNALKYTSRGEVAVTVDERAEGLALRVSDTGPGIAPEWIDRIFDPYVRLPDVRRAPGHGLGLAIVRQLCDLLGARIDVETAPGNGSRFTLVLPRDRDEAAREVRPVDAGFEGLHVLFVEDDARARAALGAMLATWGCQVSAGATLEAALGAATGVPRPVDVLISDYRLGVGEDGLAVIARARATLDPALPALLVSGQSDAALTARADALGVPLLVKPVDVLALRATLISLTMT